MTVGIIIAVIIIVCIGLYNSLIGRKNQVENVFGSVDAMLKKRYDLIPNLVATVKRYMTHEANLLTLVTELRSRALSTNLSNDDRVDLENQISQTMQGIFIAVENYPDLKANENFMQLQRALNEIEEQISAARRSYNAAVTAYNNVVEMFPTSIFAGIMKYSRKKVFEIPDDERQNANIEELFKSE